MRSKRQQDDASDAGTDQDAEVTRCRVEPDAARQILGTDDVIEQELARGLPQHAGAAMDDQQHHGVPHLQRIGEEKIAQPSDAMMNSPIPHWMMRRGSNRSARAPAATEKARNGSQCDSTAKPASAGE